MDKHVDGDLLLDQHIDFYSFYSFYLQMFSFMGKNKIFSIIIKCHILH
jgi:hypothetical protein